LKTGKFPFGNINFA